MYYHATDYKNIESIMRDGIQPGCDGIVYLTDKPEYAVRFVLFRGIEKILVLGVDVENVVETTDHSEEFFGCKAYGVPIVPSNRIELDKSYVYDNPLANLCTLHNE